MASKALSKLPQPERELRKLAAMRGFFSLHALTRAAHVDRVTLRLALRGTREPQRATVERLARTLGVDSAIVVQLFASARTRRG